MRKGSQTFLKKSKEKIWTKKETKRGRNKMNYDKKGKQI